MLWILNNSRTHKQSVQLLSDEIVSSMRKYISKTNPFGKRSRSLYARWTYMARYLPKLSKHQILSQASDVAFLVPSFRGLCKECPGPWPPFAEENVAFSDSGFPMEARVMNLIRYINRKKYFKNISTCLTTSFKTIMDTATLTGLAAGIGWIANKVLKMNFTADPSSNVKNYAKFTAVMAGSIALKQYPRQEDSSWFGLKKWWWFGLKKWWWPALWLWLEVQFSMPLLSLAATILRNT